MNEKVIIKEQKNKIKKRQVKKHFVQKTFDTNNKTIKNIEDDCQRRIGQRNDVKRIYKQKCCILGV